MIGQNKSGKNFVWESLHRQAVLLDKSDEICKGDENFVRRKTLSDKIWSINLRYNFLNS